MPFLSFSINRQFLQDMFSDMRVVLGTKSLNKSDESIATSAATSTQSTATNSNLSSSLLPEGDSRNGGGAK